jgi:predicted transcriptional regulator
MGKRPQNMGRIMSFSAMAWAIKQDIPRSCEKFVLVMLANYAGQDGVCYPSIDRLSEELSQDRKTVLKSIKSLISLGLIRDTGRRVGKTRSVVVYQLTGVPEFSRFHYLYRVENPDTGEYYVGTRSTNMLPHMDEYFGSGDWCREMKEKGVFLHKEIVKVFGTSEECKAAESKVFKSLQEDDGLCRNKQAAFAARATLRKYNESHATVYVFDDEP